MIADKLARDGWRCGVVSYFDGAGRKMICADPHRGDGSAVEASRTLLKQKRPYEIHRSSGQSHVGQIQENARAHASLGRFPSLSVDVPVPQAPKSISENHSAVARRSILAAARRSLERSRSHPPGPEGLAAVVSLKASRTRGVDDRRRMEGARRGERGMSWTLDRARAEFFARYSCGGVVGS